MAAPTTAEVFMELDRMRLAEATGLEHLEPLAARLGLSAADAAYAVAGAQQRLAALTVAVEHFRQLAEGRAD